MDGYYSSDDEALRGALDAERQKKLDALARARAVSAGTLPDGTPISDQSSVDTMGGYTGQVPYAPPSGREEFGLGGNTYGGNKFGGQTFGGETHGGNTFGGNKFGASAPPRLPDGTPVADQSPVDAMGNYTGAVPTPYAPPSGRAQFPPASDPNDLPPVPGNNVPPLPAPTQIAAAPGVNAPVAGYTPTPPDNAPPPPSATPAGSQLAAMLAPPQSGGSGYGDAVSTMGALAQSLYRMGLPGIRDRSNDLSPIADLPGQLQQRRANDQRLAAGDMELQQQQAVRQYMASPEFAKTYAGLPAQLQGVVAAAAKAGDFKTIAGMFATQTRYSQPVNLGQGWTLDRATGMASNLTTGQHAMLGANGQLTPISAPGAGPQQSGQPQGGNAQAPEWARDLPEGVNTDKLTGLSENVRNRAIRVIQGLDAMPSSARNNPMNQAVIDAVSAAHPGFDPARAAGAATMVKNVSSGKISDELTNFATVHDHAAELAEASKALNNGDLVAANKILNNLGYQSGSTARVAFDNIKNAYSHELAGVLSKGHITDAEVSQANAGISNEMSPAQIQTAMSAGQKLMQDKINQRYATAYTAAGKRIDPYFERFGLAGGPQKRQQSEPQGSQQPSASGFTREQALDEARRRGLVK